jgi:predicted Rossmann-fold nucleotide-binding protein
MPGGTGTLDELIEAVTLKRLGQYLQPIVLLNQDGFYDSLIALIDRMVDEEFMNPEHRNLWTVVAHANEVASALKTTPLWDAQAVLRAAVK